MSAVVPDNFFARMQGAAFFGFGAGQGEKFSGWGEGERNRATIKLGAFSGWAGAVMKIFGAGAPIFPCATLFFWQIVVLEKFFFTNRDNRFVN